MREDERGLRPEQTLRVATQLLAAGLALAGLDGERWDPVVGQVDAALLDQRALEQQLIDNGVADGEQAIHAVDVSDQAVAERRSGGAEHAVVISLLLQGQVHGIVESRVVSWMPLDDGPDGGHLVRMEGCSKAAIPLVNGPQGRGHAEPFVREQQATIA